MQRFCFLFAFTLLAACGSGTSGDGASEDDDQAQEDGGSVKLTINKAEHGTITASPSGPYELGAVVTLTAKADDTYGFGGWVGLDGTVNPATITLDENTTVSATFVKDAVTVLASASPAIGGDVSVTPAPPYTKGQQVQITATPASGYAFKSWDAASSTDTTLSVTLTDDLTLVATFARIPANVAISVQPPSAAAVDVSPAGQHYVGDTVSVTLTPNQGYVFNSWADGNAGNSRQIVLTGDTALSATMIPVPVLTGDATHVGNESSYVISWTYAGDVVTYALEESYKGAPFKSFMPQTTSQRSYSLAIPVDRDIGTHCYRVRAHIGFYDSPYSNTHCVERLPGEKRIKIINDIANWAPSGQRLNDIVRLHVGIGDDSWSNPNKLTPVQVIRADGASFTIVTSGLPSSYQVDFAAGYWDCQGTGGSCFWHATQTKVVGCDQHTLVYKLQAVSVTNHTYDTTFIHTSDWLPVGNYGQCIDGRCATDPVCY